MMYSNEALLDERMTLFEALLSLDFPNKIAWILSADAGIPAVNAPNINGLGLNYNRLKKHVLFSLLYHSLFYVPSVEKNFTAKEFLQILET